jgi:hypothetical protein
LLIAPAVANAVFVLGVEYESGSICPTARVGPLVEGHARHDLVTGSVHQRRNTHQSQPRTGRGYPIPDFHFKRQLCERFDDRGDERLRVDLSD